MKLSTAKFLSLFLLASAFAGNVQADRYADDGDRGSCCPLMSCYECSCNPLYCGAFDLQLQGGVNPIIWRQRGGLELVNCTVVAPALPVSSILATLPKFRSFFRIPWIVGGQIGYAWSDNTRVYAEFNYSQARAKSATEASTSFALVGLTPATTLTAAAAKYRLYDFYVGARYYTDRWCDRVAFFLGGKIGLTHHRSVSFNPAINVTGVAAPVLLLAAPVNLFNSNTGVSGGANVGFDVCFWGNWSFVVTGEIVASCGPRSNVNIPLTAVAPLVAPFTNATNLLVGQVQTELRFPVTAAFRYSF